MHPTAMDNGKIFFDTYSSSFISDINTTVVEIGSQDVNGSLRQVCPPSFSYVGVDFQEENGVDIVLDDPYVLPFLNESVDIVVSSSCFEHSEMFWLVFLEILRVLKPKGIFYLNAPSTGSFHRYPVDCWRFYPDSGKALITWAKRSGYSAELLESYTQKGGEWQDYVSIFIKDGTCASFFKDRILDSKNDFENGQVLGSNDVLNFNDISQNDKRINFINHITTGQILIN